MLHRSIGLDQYIDLTINISAWSEWSSGNVFQWRRNEFKHVASDFDMTKKKI